MSDIEINDEHSISRYCRPSSLSEEGLPLASAFELREDRDEYLSVNWVEFFNAPDLAKALDYIRLTFREKGFRISHNGRFVSLQVGKVKDVIQLNSNLPPQSYSLTTKRRSISLRSLWIYCLG